MQPLKPYPAYKDSGVPWLGNVPAHWEVRQLKYIARLVYGDALPADTRQDGEVPVLGSNGQVGLHTSPNTRAPCIVIGRKGSFGKVNYSAEPVFAIDTTFLVDSRLTAANLRWLFFVLGWLRLDAVSRDSAVPGLDREDAYRRVVPVPPAVEQSTIVCFLDHMDRRIRRAIRAKQKLIALLNEQKQSIIHRAVTRGLDPNIRLKPSGAEWLGDVPEHWVVRTLGQIATSFRTGPFGSILHQSDYVEGGTPLVNPTHLNRGGIVEDMRCSVPTAVVDRLSNYLLAKHDLIFSRRGELGRCALVRDREVGWICGTGSIRVRVSYVGIEPEYLIEALQVRWVSEYLSLFSVGATMDSLNTGILKGIPVLLPPASEQRSLLEYISHGTRTIQRAMSDAQREASLLREYRTRLIADVVTGKLDVREAAARLPEEVDEPEAIDAADTLMESDEEMEEADLDAALEEATA